MALKGLSKAVVILMSVLAIALTGCSSNNPAGPGQNNLLSSGIDQSLNPNPGIDNSSADAALSTNGFTVTNPNDSRSYDASFSGRVTSVDYKNRIIEIDGKADFQIYVERDAAVYIQPYRYATQFVSYTTGDSRSSQAISPVTEGTDITVYGTFKGDQLFIALRVDVYPQKSSEDFVTTGFTANAPAVYSRDYDVKIAGRVSSVDYSARSFQLEDRAGMSFVLDKDARVISLPDRTEISFVVDNGRTASRAQDGAIEQGSRVVAYGTLKGDELLVVGLLEVINDNMVGDVSIGSSGQF